MISNYIYADVNQALPQLCAQLMSTGALVDSRAGKTREMTFVGVTLMEPLNREILLPSRRASYPAQIAETMWVLNGRNDIGWLSHYLPRAADFSDDGKTWRAGYGLRLRRYESAYSDIDQVQGVIEKLRADPVTRQAVISLWDPELDQEAITKDIPCNNWLHFLSRNGFLDLHVSIRSNDLIWGWSGINQFEWSVLLELVAVCAGLVPGRIHYSISSLHVYEHHWQRAGEIALDEPVRPSNPEHPRLYVDSLAEWDMLTARWFELEETIRNGKPNRSHISDFPDPLLRSWLYVLDKHWNGVVGGLSTNALYGSAIAVAADLSPKRKQSKPESESEPKPILNGSARELYTYVCKLHADKNAAYGDSWKKRGEAYSIIPNIARKVDRLGVTDDHETALDTAIDLLVYLGKYRNWLTMAPRVYDEVVTLNRFLAQLPVQRVIGDVSGYIAAIREDFELLCDIPVNDENTDRKLELVDEMAQLANVLVQRYWSER